MKIIPVMDIKEGKVVHAVRGERKAYEPIKSMLCSSHDPLDVAMAFRRMGFFELYVADLDAIEKKKDNASAIKDIKGTGMPIMLDAGVCDVMDAERVLVQDVDSVIMATESLFSLSAAEEIVKRIGKARIIFSVDVKRGEILSSSEEIKQRGIPGIVDFLKRMGIGRVILLDLSKVGSREGVNIESLPLFSDFDVIVGGGVRDMKDLYRLKSKRVWGVLIATALHEGRIGAADLAFL